MVARFLGIVCLIISSLLDVGAQDWDTYQLSVARGVRDGGASIGTRAFFAGGQTDDNNNYFSDVIEIYDNATNNWSTKKLSVARGFLASAASQEYVIFAGGQTNGDVPSDVVDVFDANGEFVRTEHLPGGPRFNLCAAAVGNKFYFAGGQPDAASSYTDRVEIYDPTLPEGSRWLSTTLSVPRRTLVAAVLGTKVYVMGGRDPSGNGSDVVDIFDGTVREQGLPLSKPRAFGHTAVSTGSIIFVAGGNDGTNNLATVDIIMDNGERQVKLLSEARHIVASATNGRKVFFAGGRSAISHTRIDIWDLTSEGWDPPGNLSLARHDIGAASVGVKVIFAGGWNDPSPNNHTKVVDIYDPEVELGNPIKPNVIEKEATGEVASVPVDDVGKVKSVVFSSVGISTPEAAPTTTQLQPEGKVYKKTFSSSDLTDPIGIIYDIIVTDFSDRIQNVGKTVANIRYPDNSTEQSISLRAGTKVSDYQIVAVPLELAEKSAADVFDDLGGYDKTKWRLFDWKPGTNVTGYYREYQNGLNSIQPGKGYWLITRTGSVANPGVGTTVSLTGSPPNDLYTTITLEPGWNLIGNPFNFTLSWTKVASYAENASANIGSLYVFPGGTLAVGTNLPSHSGGFIENLSSSNITLKIPASKALSGGRVASPEPIDLAAHHWQIPLTLTDGELSNQTGGIGMHKQATLTGRDQFDGVSVPLLKGVGIPEMVFKHPEYDTDFCREIVPTADHYEWEFQVVSTSENQLRLEWDPSLLEEGSKELYLFDPATMDMKNMRTDSYYLVPPSSKSLRILFGERTYIQERRDQLLPLFGQPYPNPAAGEVFVPFHIGENMGEVNIAIQVYDGLGRYVETIASDKFSTGDHQAVWNTGGRSGLFVVSMASGDGQVSRTKVIVK
jgi:hypothetical protein